MSKGWIGRNLPDEGHEETSDEQAAREERERVEQDQREENGK